MRCLLSIDWDYFVPEGPNSEWGHQESLLFLTTLWMFRGSFANDTATTGEEVVYWDYLKENGARFHTDTMWVSDSHAYAYQCVKPDHDAIVLVDAHHDVWARHGEEDVHCDDWLRCAMNVNPSLQVFWHQADWSADSCSLPDDLTALERGQIALNEFPDEFDVVDLHVCRSGCWTPPWHDAQFLEFIKDAPTSVRLPMQIDDWCPFDDRYNGEMKEAIAEHTRRAEEVFGLNDKLARAQARL